MSGRERIRVQGDPVSPEDLPYLVERTRPRLERIHEQMKTLLPGASFRQRMYF